MIFFLRLLNSYRQTGADVRGNACTFVCSRGVTHLCRDPFAYVGWGKGGGLEIL